jgi:leucyl-tRNA synthetase
VNTHWPKTIAELVSVDEVMMAIQINGKRRAEILLAKGADRAIVEAKVLEMDAVKRVLEGKQVKKIIVVPDRIVNIVVAE